MLQIYSAKSYFVSLCTELFYNPTRVFGMGDKSKWIGFFGVDLETLCFAMVRIL